MVRPINPSLGSTEFKILKVNVSVYLIGFGLSFTLIGVGRLY